MLLTIIFTAGAPVVPTLLSSVPIASFTVLNLATTDWGCNVVSNAHAGVSSSMYQLPTTHQEYIIFAAAAVLVVYIYSCLWEGGYYVYV